MKHAGQIVLTPFPYTDLSGSKLRPVLMLRRASRFDDWLVCMVSSRIEQAAPALDEILLADDADYHAAGLKVPSVFRLSRLAVLDGARLAGSIGAIPDERLSRLRERLARWICEAGSHRGG
jgi:mRNA interferase MazF